ncbi:MAG: ABC transporter ATP-binding protein [Gammaproteobacteria bacterium]|nr:ABC transporter ATP-binding protein [Gammaproteobacteria bacterium]MBT4605787.1 ABC transporter ATP-binding protein [Thiotrichales bacterium]MBT3473314.1 ABC transporter ATP-binding protein [Gammaproteobacteria bacterium]MBT3967748.1 ABC transporter ATP-binding protein [Gammaproteobacteria bacterium]MBT4079340.1 ABC transporter ATP-binding protein [Gammaproteobacteria bacterium]
MTLLKIEGVEKRYRQGEVDVDALTAIDLQIDCGEFVALVGPSGSGKTTLLNLIGGLDRADRGSIQLNGVELTSMEETALSQFRLTEIGFVFQAYNLVPVLSALENVELVMVLQGVPPQQCRARAIEYLQRVGLESMMDRRPAALSGGQQQRVAVARALAAGPRLVLADEPTANLDSENATALLDLMEQLCHQQQTTFIFSTHDPRVMQRAERTVTLQDGRIISDQKSAL